MNNLTVSWYADRNLQVPIATDVHLFRDGIKPTWEDPSNAVSLSVLCSFCMLQSIALLLITSLNRVFFKRCVFISGRIRGKFYRTPDGTVPDDPIFLDWEICLGLL